ncbi:hypothetical protein FEM48_Zijuj03G0004600 [Ziziphus jujuba var. spinosa]|uniref:AAA+ ATPase domain-containing protein n=1 Tax=Ziziphus jujuba var. spinosa TaxID=714518 RepID=A0A978VM51_ZIZJJ|nr:hypothetical protein FEM48_Zijuj03G0004600 [Ziziphus jujuba var. spinosa]
MKKRSAGSNLIKLRRRIEHFKHRESSSVDEIVDHLRNNYQDYNRIKLNDLNRLVEKTQRSFHRQTNAPMPTPSGGRSLQQIENDHDHSSSSEESGAVSTTSELDLTKSTLRASYTKSNTTRKAAAAASDEKNKMELAAGDNKIDMFDISILPNESGREAQVVVVKGNEGGPKFKDLGGMDKVLKELKKEFLVSLCHPQSVWLLGMKPMAGVLLHGPPGCGKTTLAHAIDNETGLSFYRISATEVISGVSGASEENIRELFQKACRTAPSIVFIDEIDTIASKRENLQRQMDRQVVTQLITCMDELHRPTVAHSDSETSDNTSGNVLVIGATNWPNTIDPARRRPGGFGREIELGVPDENARAQILAVITSNRRVEGSFDLLKIARSTAGFVGADLVDVVDKAANLALNRVIDERKSLISEDSMDKEHSIWWRRPLSPEEEDNLFITMADCEQAVKQVQPSSKREGFSTIPDEKWEDVGGLDLLREEFVRDIVWHVKYPEIHQEYEEHMEAGILLYGPPGCGKTLLAKAIANEAGLNFIHIIVDALTKERGTDGGPVADRLLNQVKSSAEAY